MYSMEFIYAFIIFPPSVSFLIISKKKNSSHFICMLVLGGMCYILLSLHVKTPQQKEGHVDTKLKWELRL